MKKECTVCGGSGQVGFFQGVSRFLITWEECPECFGTGYTGTQKEKRSTGKKSNKDTGGGRKKKG